ncbi:MAG TPA: nitroreductase family protein [Bryobacteraceae bacterium]|nr:nitroreductase family protein [Bryobacteraceae bacterium]
MPENHQLLEVIRKRWSPRIYNGREVEPWKLRTLFEAAGWAASCFGEEPWRFIVASRADRPQFDRLLGLLVEKNRQWAQHAGALAISFGKKSFTQTGAPDRFGLHDTGTSFGQMSLQAVALGLQVHGMGGFDAERTRKEFAVPEDFEVGAAIAIGYLDGDGAPPAGRKRKPLEEIVFTGDWGRPAGF